MRVITKITLEKNTTEESKLNRIEIINNREVILRECYGNKEVKKQLKRLNKKMRERSVEEQEAAVREGRLMLDLILKSREELVEGILTLKLDALMALRMDSKETRDMEDVYNTVRDMRTEEVKLGRQPTMELLRGAIKQVKNF